MADLTVTGTDTETQDTSQAAILVVDGDVVARDPLVGLLRDSGYLVEAVDSGEEAMEAVRRSAVDLVITDLHLPEIDGVELLRRLEQVNGRLLGIVLTGNGSMAHAVRAMKAGAFNFIPKPVDSDAVGVSVQRALEFRKLREDNQRLQSAVRDRYHFKNLLGNSPAMWSVYELIEKVSETDSPIMISGESGTGKELVSRTIHYNSSRMENPLVSVSCSAFPQDILERDIFGYEQGAFAGAVVARIGKLERANGGTIFLDDVTEMGLSLQAKLLRVLQEGAFEPVGGNRTVKVDVRVIAATNRNLQQAVANKQFRDDLYYRLNVIDVTLPPLRDRVSDIPLLVEHCLEKFSNGRPDAVRGISLGAVRLLERYTWPGNVRELENVLERIVTLKRGGMIEEGDIPRNISQAPAPTLQGSAGVFGDTLPHQEAEWGHDVDIDLSKSVDAYETRLIMEALRRSRGVKSRAAQLLKMNRTTLVEKLKKKGLSKSDFSTTL